MGTLSPTYCTSNSRNHILPTINSPMIRWTRPDIWHPSMCKVLKRQLALIGLPISGIVYSSKILFLTSRYSRHGDWNNQQYKRRYKNKLNLSINWKLQHLVHTGMAYGAHIAFQLHTPEPHAMTKYLTWMDHFFYTRASGIMQIVIRRSERPCIHYSITVILVTKHLMGYKSVEPITYIIKMWKAVQLPQSLTSGPYAALIATRMGIKVAISACHVSTFIQITMVLLRYCTFQSNGYTFKSWVSFSIGWAGRLQIS